MDANKMEQLGAVVSEVDAQGGPTPEQAAEQEKAQSLEQGAKEWGAIVYMVGGALSMLAPELKPIYSEARCLAWGQSVMPVAEKYGWNGPGSIPELGLAISTLSLAVPTALILKAKLAELKQAKEAAEDAADGIRKLDPLADVVGGAAVVGAADGG